jgi:hypothetical protein
MLPAVTAEQVTRRTGERAPGAGLGPSGRPTLSDRLPRPWLFPLLLFAATWLLIQAAWWGSALVYGRSLSWTRFGFVYKDAGWFLTIAQHGYPAHLATGGGPGSAGAFFPVFPGLVRLASYLTAGNYVAGGLVVSILAGAASSLLVWLLAARVRDRWVADRAAALYCFFPGAMTFGMLYSEPVTVALAAAALLALVNRRWLVAGIVGAFATAEASILIVVAAVAGVTALHAIWTRREWRALLAPVLAPVGILAYFAYLGHRYHDYRFWFQIEQHGWNAHVDWGARTAHILLWNTQVAFQHRFVFTVYFIMLIVVAAGIGMLLAARLALPVALYGVLMPLTFLISDANPRPRYVLCAFPLFIGAAAKLPRALYWPVLVLSAAGLCVVVAWWPHHPIGPAP